MNQRTCTSESKKKAFNKTTNLIFEKGFDQDHHEYCIPYELGDQLGRGGFAKCHAIRIANQTEQFAVKIFDKHSNRSQNLQKIYNEIDIMSSLKHQGIVQFYRKFQDEKKVFMIMELCKRGSLNDVIKNRGYLTEPEVRYIISQLVPVLQYLKQQKIIHRDIKMGNIFFNQHYQVKLGDFGLAIRSDSPLFKKNICGTPNYIAPQIINREKYSHEVDVWSTGVLAYTLLLGRPPFQAKSASITYDLIVKCEYDFETASDDIQLSAEAKNFLIALIEKDRPKRIKLEEIMHQPFLTKYELPKQLEHSFPFTEPSKNFMQKYDKIMSQSDNAVQQKMEFQGSKIRHSAKIVKKQNPKAYLKIEINLCQASASSSGTISDSSISFLKRHSPPQSSISNYFAKAIKTFRKNNLISRVETRSMAKKKQEDQALATKCQHILQHRKALTPRQIKKLFKLEQQNHIHRRHQLTPRILYIKKVKNQNCIVYLTNLQLLGVLYSDSSSIIYHPTYKTAYYIQLDSLQAINLKDELSPEKCSALKEKIDFFASQHKDFKQIVKSDSSLKNALTISSDILSSFTFVKSFDFHLKKIIVELSNGDVQLFIDDSQSLLLSAQKEEVIFVRKTEQQVKAPLQHLQQLPECKKSKLLLACDLIMSAQSAKGKAKISKQRRRRRHTQKGHQSCPKASKILRILDN